jgi:2-C-methyl-D-erythritol 4-phosphate cytidylyltransferase
MTEDMAVASAADTTITLIVPAAGCGARANLNGNKILAPLCGRPLLWHTLRALTAAVDGQARATHLPIVEVIIASRPEEWHDIRQVCAQLTSSTPIVLVEGGATRQDSVCSALQVANGEYIAVHDAARPLVTPSLFQRVFEAACISGAAIPALPARDTIKLARREESTKSQESPPSQLPIIEATLERGLLWMAQTPQVFKRELLAQAFESATRDNFVGTDCSSLVERLTKENGEFQEVTLVVGEECNFKVTYAEDLERVAALIDVAR